MNADQVIDQIFQIYQERGHQLYGESVTESEHALQCATLARSASEPPQIVAACLIHDFGHLCHDLGEDVAERGIDSAHEDIGANRLARWFPPEVVEPIRLHVAAKRYLCWKNPDYHSGLSQASRRSLQLQGGPMSDAEGQAFERHPHYQAAVRVRTYDDHGKVDGMELPPFETFRGVLRSVALSALHGV